MILLLGGCQSLMHKAFSKSKPLLCSQVGQPDGPAARQSRSHTVIFASWLNHLQLAQDQTVATEHWCAGLGPATIRATTPQKAQPLIFLIRVQATATHTQAAVSARIPRRTAARSHVYCNKRSYIARKVSGGRLRPDAVQVLSLAVATFCRLAIPEISLLLGKL